MYPSTNASTSWRATFLPLALLALAGCLPTGESDPVEKPLDDTGSEVASDQQIVGSVGDGPIVSANIQVRADDGSELGTITSDSSASYDVTVKARGSHYPLRLDSTGGTDLVTSTDPDFILKSAVLRPGNRSVANINPFTTFAVELASDLPGGRTEDNVVQALTIVSGKLNSGLTTLVGQASLSVAIDAGNIAEIVRASEALGEAVRRTRGALRSVGFGIDGSEIVAAVASDLSDGMLDGGGGPGTDARTTAVFGVAYAQVLLETMRNELHVNGVDATVAMESAVAQVFSGTPEPGFDSLPVTADMVVPARSGVLAANWLQPSTILDTVLVEIDSLTDGMSPATARNVMAIDAATQMAVALTTLANASADDINTVNDILRTGVLPSDNTAPTISGAPVTSVDAGQLYAFAPQANDTDGDNLVFSIVGRPGWAQFNALTGELRGVPTEGDAGLFPGITISVTDGETTASLPAFSISVDAAEVNTPPVISGVPATQVTVGSEYDFVPAGFDFDGDSLTYSIANRPGWAVFSSSSGRLVGTPEASNVGDYTGIEISVSDGEATTMLPAFSIAVTAEILPNNAPEISGIPVTSVDAGSAYSFQPQATDADGDTLAFSISGRPGWASFNATTGRLSGTPGTGDIGDWSGITISVNDGEDSSSLPPFAISVAAVAGNASPQISGTPPSVVVVGTSYGFTPVASDDDGDSLSFSIDGLPGWANFDPANGRLSGTPGAGDIALYGGISITVTDGEDSATLGPFSVSVEAVVLGSATLTWSPPTTNTDGTPLVDLAGYRLYWGAQQGDYTESVTLDNPGLTSYVVENLAPGTWYFVSTSLNAEGVESAYSNSVARVIP